MEVAFDWKRTRHTPHTAATAAEQRNTHICLQLENLNYSEALVEFPLSSRAM